MQDMTTPDQQDEDDAEPTGPLVTLTGRCGTCGGTVTARLGHDAGWCGCGAAMLDILTNGGSRCRMAGPVRNLEEERGRPMDQAPRDGTVLRAWTRLWNREIEIAWDDDAWLVAGDEASWVSDRDLLAWTPRLGDVPQPSL